ncbi:MAG: triose-phosphate isomerase, partial [Desulfobulbaceae bacterium]|nr:triose-phosphate isomerase [Desulfobulbaceae bacterium]
MDMDRRPLIAGNWKMHTTVQEAQQLASALVLAVAKVAGRDVMIAPPYTALAAVGKILSGTGVMLGAQNVHWEEKGAFTGEISAAMLKDVGCV